MSSKNGVFELKMAFLKIKNRNVVPHHDDNNAKILALIINIDYIGGGTEKPPCSYEAKNAASEHTCK